VLQTLLKLIDLIANPITSRFNLLGRVGVYRLKVGKNLRSLFFKLLNSMPHRFGIKVGKSFNKGCESFLFPPQFAKRLTQLVAFLVKCFFLIFYLTDCRGCLLKLSLKALLFPPMSSEALTDFPHESNPAFRHPTPNLRLSAVTTQGFFDVRLITLKLSNFTPVLPHFSEVLCMGIL